jgi:hypothetical protein
MRLRSSQLKTWVVLWVCAGAFALAGGCGSDDGKKATQAEEAGAAGQSDGGGPSSGGSESSAAGATPAPSAGQAGADLGGAGGVANAPEAGQAGQMAAGGAPTIDHCAVNGSVTGLSLLTEPIYQGCRGSLVHVPFGASDSTATFTCCGVSTSSPAFGAALPSVSNFDGGGDLLLEVPSDAPFGSYAVNLTCPTQPSNHAFALEINDAAAPIVTGATAQIASGDTLVVSGENLDTLTSITAVRPSDGTVSFCNIDLASQSATSVSCTFNSIPPSANDADVYVLDVANETCGAARNRPTLIANQSS